jgi:hypothetical protein
VSRNWTCGSTHCIFRGIDGTAVGQGLTEGPSGVQEGSLRRQWRTVGTTNSMTSATNPSSVASCPR